MASRARTRCRPTSRSTRCCRCSTATRWRSSSTATKFVGLDHPHRPDQPFEARRDEPSTSNRLAFSTRTHPWRPEPDPTTGAVMVPIYATSTYAQESPGVHKGFEYARSQNPTRLAFERASPTSRAARAGFAFASGLAGDRHGVRAARSRRPCRRHRRHLWRHASGCSSGCAGARPGCRSSFVDFTDLAAVEAAIRPETKHALGRDADQSAAALVDLEAIAGARAGARADGLSPTTPSPAPTSSGRWSSASTSSCIRRRNTSTAIPTWSAASSSSATTRSSRDQLHFLQNAVGAISGPVRQFSGAARLEDAGAADGAALRQRRCKIAAMAGGAHATSRRVIYPGLASHPQHALAKAQMHGFGGMVTVELDRDLAGAKRFLERTQLFTLAESLGGVESLIEHPAIMTHGLGPGRGARRARHRRRPRAPLGRHRGCRRSDRRPQERAGVSLSLSFRGSRSESPEPINACGAECARPHQQHREGSWLWVPGSGLRPAPE